MNRRLRSNWLPGLRELLLVCFFLSLLRPVFDFDVWLHLAAGRHMWETGRVLRTDVFSHTVTGKAWVYHEWLAAVFFQGLHRLGGLNALLLWQALTMTASMGALLATLRLRGHGRGAPAVLVLLAAMVASRNVALERPHLFTILFLSLFAYWLNRQALRGRPLPWGMAVIAALWANVHGGFVLGLLAFGPFMAQDAWSWWRGGGRLGPRSPGEDEAERGLLTVAAEWLRSEVRGRPGRHPEARGPGGPAGPPPPEAASAPWAPPPALLENPKERLTRSALVLAACCAAALVNPYGAETLLYPLQYANPSGFLRQIDEWASPNFQRQILLEAVLLALAGALMVSRRAVALADGIFAMATAHLILTGVRNSFLVGPFIGPGAVAHVADFFERPGLPERLARKFERLDSGRFGLFLCLTVVLGGASLLWRPERVMAGQYPAEAVQWLKQHRPPGALFNDYNWGGYLMFHLPEYPVFVDGRADVYSRHDAFGDFLAVWHVTPGWLSVLERRGVRLVLIEQRQSLAALLGASAAWRELYRDDTAVIYQRR